MPDMEHDPSEKERGQRRDAGREERSQSRGEREDQSHRSHPSGETEERHVSSSARSQRTSPRVEDEQRRQLGEAVRHSRLTLNELWLYYFSLGGTAGEYEVDAYLNASYSLPSLQRDILAHAVNEMIDMLPPAPRAPYSTDMGQAGPNSDPDEDGHNKTKET